MAPLTPEELTGQTRSHVVQKEGYALHPECLKAFERLYQAGVDENLEIKIFSSFRDFKAQCRIWNMKWEGQRPIYDAQGIPLDYNDLSPLERFKAILNWSAIPGTSRHHWGSDIDLYDANGLLPGQKIELLPYEYAAGGPFDKLNQWLDAHLTEFNFFRPYEQNLGGVQPEPWHVSYRPISQPALQAMTPDLIKHCLQSSNLGGKELILDQLDWVLSQYVFNISG